VGLISNVQKHRTYLTFGASEFMDMDRLVDLVSGFPKPKKKAICRNNRKRKELSAL